MINLNPMIANSLKGAMEDELGIELPFPAPLLYVLNGQAAYKQLGNAQYFGGWACDREKMVEAIEEAGKQFPLTLTEAMGSTDSGKEYKIYCARAVVVAPIGRRISWVIQTDDEVKRATKYSKGARMHVQLLGYLAEKNPDKKIVPWGPVQLSAKGIQAGNLLAAFRDWKKASKDARKKHANDLDSAWFYLPIGTFGERNTIEVGKTKKSTITPIRPFLPETIDEPYLTKMFVGETIAGEMASLNVKAAEWLSAWKAPQGTSDEPPTPPDAEGEEEAF